MNTIYAILLATQVVSAEPTLQDHLANLDSGQFIVRQEADKALRLAGYDAIGVMEAHKPPSAEVRFRINKILRDYYNVYQDGDKVDIWRLPNKDRFPYGVHACSANWDVSKEYYMMALNEFNEGVRKAIKDRNPNLTPDELGIKEIDVNYWRDHRIQEIAGKIYIEDKMREGMTPYEAKKLINHMTTWESNYWHDGDIYYCEGYRQGIPGHARPLVERPDMNYDCCCDGCCGD